MYDNELYHFGVKGMKWGHRKALPKSDLRNRYDRARAEKKAAYKEYSKSYNYAYNRSANPIPLALTKKGRAKTDAAWKNTYDAANKTIAATDKFKAVKKERKQALKDAYKDVNKNTSLATKAFVMNKNSRKAVAKYMVDNNMSMTDAKKKVNKEIVRDTAILLGVSGGLSVATLMLEKKILN